MNAFIIQDYMFGIMPINQFQSSWLSADYEKFYASSTCSNLLLQMTFTRLNQTKTLGLIAPIYLKF